MMTSKQGVVLAEASAVPRPVAIMSLRQALLLKQLASQEAREGMRSMASANVNFECKSVWKDGWMPGRNG